MNFRVVIEVMSIQFMGFADFMYLEKTPEKTGKLPYDAHCVIIFSTYVFI